MLIAPARPLPLKFRVNPPSVWPPELLPPPPHTVACPVDSTVPSDEVRTAGPSAVKPPQSPFLFAVPWKTALPSTKLRVHLSENMNVGQIPWTETKDCTGPASIGFTPQVGSLRLQWPVPLVVGP